MSEQIEACPFCGIDSIKEDALYCDNHNFWFYVKCEMCGAEGPIERNEELAIAHWNERAK